MNKCLYVYGIPAHIHSNKGWSFGNEILTHLDAMYGIEQSTTTPYTPHRNIPTLIDLLKSLQNEKSNLPVHLPSLVFAYNATPHNTTSYQPLLMFGCKAPAICDAWFGLANYNDN